MTKPQLLAFDSLRGYPLLQLRKLCAALRDRTLPLGRPEVQLLVRSALYQVGELRGREGEETMLFWKNGDLVEGAVLPALEAELASTLSTLQCRISEAAEMLAVIDITTYLLAWHRTHAFEALRRSVSPRIRPLLALAEEKRAALR